MRVRLLLLAAALAGLWYLAGHAILSSEEQALWETVRAAQTHLSEWRERTGTAVGRETDPWGCGLIGVEWSGITTSLGDLEAKRTACNPAWAVWFTRQFRELGLAAGDPIAIYASGSFPGLLLNAIAASEAFGLDPLLAVSLGASTWGANQPEAPWPLLAAELRRGGYIRKRADFYTLGGEAELGQGMAPEAADLLLREAQDAGVGLLTAPDLAGMIARKTELLREHEPLLVISIGGSQANLGDDEEVLRLSPGRVPAAEAGSAGNGVIGFAMRNDIPVFHMLNLGSLSGQAGIPYDAAPSKAGPMQVNPWWSLAGLGLFLLVLLTHRRWRLDPADQPGPQ